MWWLVFTCHGEGGNRQLLGFVGQPSLMDNLWSNKISGLKNKVDGSWGTMYSAVFWPLRACASSYRCTSTNMHPFFCGFHNSTIGHLEGFQFLIIAHKPESLFMCKPLHGHVVYLVDTCLGVEEVYLTFQV